MNSIIRRGAAVGLTVAACALIAGCDDSYLDQSSGRSQQPISSATLAEMDKLDTTPSSPTIIRTYKKEAELEIWKMKSNGEYALLKTYPMCRWSGQLGPKKREGDMQVPEGFYTIAPGQMNPNSHYYLSFNVGYPNAYDRAYGRTGGNVMVHGVCSSAGCFSMTDEQVADIYAIARELFAGGQREIQLQSYPFHMTAENLAKFRLDPNIDFWKDLKNGSDHFEVTKAEPSVLVCGKRYVFDATAKGEVSATQPCPALTRDENVEALVAEKEQKDDAKVAELVASGRQADSPRLCRRRAECGLRRLQGRERPGRARDRPAGDRPRRSQTRAGRGQDRGRRRRQTPRRERRAAAGRGLGGSSRPRRLANTPAVALASAPSQPSGGVLGGLNGGAQNVKKWLHLGGQEPAPPPVDASAPDQPAPAGRAAAAASRRTASRTARRRCAGVAAYAADAAGEAKCSPTRRPTTPIRRRRRRRPPRPRRRNSGASSPVVRAPNCSDPAREAGHEARRLLGVGERARRHDDRGALAQPHVNEAAGVFGLFTVGVAEPLHAPVDVQR